jgi:hypothetical protein
MEMDIKRRVNLIMADLDKLLAKDTLQLETDLKNPALGDKFASDLQADLKQLPREYQGKLLIAAADLMRKYKFPPTTISETLDPFLRGPVNHRYITPKT